MDAAAKTMKRHEWWRVQYQADPYLRGIDDQTVKVRTDDVTANSWFITDALKLGMISAPDPFWMISWTHLLEEWGSRGGIPGGPDLEKLPNLDWPGLASAVKPFEDSRRAHQGVLVKYGDRQYLRQSMEAGSFLVRPASTLESKAVGALPTQRAIGIDWPEIVYKEPETTFAFVVDEHDEWPLHWTDLLLSERADAGVLTFALVSPQESIEIALTLFVDEGVEKCRFSVLNDRRLLVRFGASLISADEFFQEHPPVVWFVDGASLEGNTFTPLKTKYAPYARERIAAWDWSGVDLRRESQGAEKAPESIQFRVIEELKKKDYDLIVDDDGPGEAADIVTIKLSSSAPSGKFVAIEFYHCKYSKAVPGRRIEDMYEVCGQAQKSIRWMYSHEKQVELFTHLLRREHDRRAKYGASRIEVGDDDRLIAIREMSRAFSITLRIFIVQPGISRTQATVDQLELLSVTENHLMETYDLPFGVIASS